MKAEQGMTLLEVLVALFILAIVATTTLQVVSRTVEIRLSSQDRALGQLCIDNQMTEQMLLAQQPALGVQEGDYKLGSFHCFWRIDVQTTPLVSMRRLDITAYANAERRYQLAHIAAFMGQ